MDCGFPRLKTYPFREWVEPRLWMVIILCLFCNSNPEDGFRGEGSSSWGVEYFGESRVEIRAILLFFFLVVER
ncbi:hypothetical protein P168DRAFT_286245 [Aspergillus campestris IBT 28561]|uniref:Uncharacterized protein n=1 Tax=Aspergillus campestris (strain IBT 28561) TaxID=1392248 RepID=A0A2I1DDY2_ASPC2|nr:uncharacterized protein P168DRAFT_286245 [Aspergillus campestris IBT 28561]PKY08088.1 hypothetical protein P168DRAFT_286245 [Aspergillus campestris IBT 28561]